MTENFPWRCLLPALILLLLLFMPAAAADESGINSQLPHSSAIAAQNIVSQIRSGQPVSYNNITVTGQLDLSLIEGPISQALVITNSRFQG
ncbi:MAG: hypothetical protein WBL92_06600, partial [Methanothrix sp.]